MYRQVAEKLRALKNKSAVVKMMFLYRYLSLLITSLFYIIVAPSHILGKKAIVIICISISSIILHYLYIKNLECESKVLFLIFIETLGNFCILIPSGGISSPYIWYSLNTILIASLTLDRKYCWINLFSYIIASTCITYLVFINDSISFYEHLMKETNLILSFTLIIFMVQMLSKYMKALKDESAKLSQINEQLLLANKRIKESMSYTKELYQAVHLLSNNENKADLIQIIVDHTKKIIKTDIVIYYSLDESNNLVLCSEQSLENSFKEKACYELAGKYKKIINSEQIVDTFIDGKSFVLIAVKSSYLPYGIIGVHLKEDLHSLYYMEAVEQLRLLAELSSIAMERFQIEQVNQGLLVSEEQNRIANEIHDSVLQRLFSISCGIFSMDRNLNKISIDKAREELIVIRNSINMAMSELRTAVYGLSWKKEGADNFTVDLLNYIDEIRKMNNVNISFDLIGDSELLTLLHKKSLYRIICEGISNAVRHGRAENISIVLKLQAEKNILELIDDGTGFDVEGIKKSKSKGLGLCNIQNLMYIIGGQVTFESRLNKGTKLYAVFPIRRENKEEKVV